MREALWIAYRLFTSLVRTIANILRTIGNWSRFWVQYRAYSKLAPEDFRPRLRHLYPCINDATDETPIEPFYFYQDTWAFEQIVQVQPLSHVDVGSHHLFVAFLSKVIPVTMVDIRPLSVSLNSLHFQQGSILCLPFKDGVLPSLSSLCVVEHIGLGRYGDTLDGQGTEKSIAELKRVIAPGGHLYISLPLDDVNRVYFNAHRAFSEQYIQSLFFPFLVLDYGYIQGKNFGRQAVRGFRVGCYHLQRPE